MRSVQNKVTKILIVRSKFYGDYEDILLKNAILRLLEIEVFKKYDREKCNFELDAISPSSVAINVISDPFTNTLEQAVGFLDSKIVPIADKANVASFSVSQFNLEFDVITVPGALEIPHAVLYFLDKNPSIDGIVALGCVIKGETTHFDHVCNETMRMLNDIAMRKRVCLGNGIITALNEKQAEVRVNFFKKNIGGLAMQACLDMIAIKNSIGRIV